MTEGIDQAMPVAERAPSRAGGRLGLDLLHLAGLQALSLGQPTYALIAANPQFLSAHAVDRWQLGLIVAGLSLAPILVAAALEVLAGVGGARVRAAVHSLLVGVFTSILALQALTRLWSNGGPVPLALAVAAGAAFTVAYRRFEPIYTFATYLSLSAVVVPVVFLLDGRVRGFLSEPADPALLDVEVGNAAPLVIVIFDELPLATLLDQEGLRIDAALFPSFARLAARSHWFRDATTTGTFTELAVPSLHTGRYTEPDRLQNGDLKSYPNNLFTLLGSTYQVHALESTTNLQPSAIARSQSVGSSADSRGPSLLLADIGAVALQVVIPRPWSARLPRLDAAWSGFWRFRDDDRGSSGPRHRVQEVREFVARLGQSSRPPFVYLHPAFPHWPWEYLPSGRRYYDGVLDLPGYDDGWLHDEWLVFQGYQRHRLQVAAADRVLGEILDRLEALGWLDDALVVVTSDHGVAFVAGASRRELPPEQEEILRAEVMPIPLLIKLPRQREAVVDDRKVEIIDLLPTIADVLEVEVPWPVEGRSLLDPEAAERPGRRLQLKEPFVTLFFDDRGPSVVRDLARRRNGWFGRTPEGVPDLFRFGSEAERVGQRVADATVSSTSLRCVLRNENLFRNIEPGDALVPSFIQGEIEPGDDPAPAPGTPLAVAVNGVLRATSRIYTSPTGKLSFGALVPEEAFTEGDNAIDVFLLGPASTLTELVTTGSQETMRAAWEASKTTLFAADASTGWKGFRGLLGTSVHADEEGALAVEAAGGVLRIELPRFDAGGADAFIVAIEIESETEISPILYYMTAKEPVFRLGRFALSRARKGRGASYFEVRDPDLIGGLSLDLGRRGRIRLHSVDVRSGER